MCRGVAARVRANLSSHQRATIFLPLRQRPAGMHGDVHVAAAALPAD